MSEIPFSAFRSSMGKGGVSVDMSSVVGSKDILLICLDTLRYDAAIEEEMAGTTPVLNSYGPWEKRQTPGNFTYPAHHAIFSGFFPMPDSGRSLADSEVLFFPKDIGMGRKTPNGSYAFSSSNIVEGLHRDGYDTWCIGGVTFFDKRSEMGSVFPNMFEKSYWTPGFSCSVKESIDKQVDFIINKISKNEDDRKIFMYMNVSAIHYPNYFYGDNTKNDSLETHKAALRYTDARLGRLFEEWKRIRGDAFVICLSDHGTSYGEDGFTFHAVNHPVVNTVPYKHFFI